MFPSQDDIDAAIVELSEYEIYSIGAHEEDIDAAMEEIAIDNVCSTNDYGYDCDYSVDSEAEGITSSSMSSVQRDGKSTLIANGRGNSRNSLSGELLEIAELGERYRLLARLHMQKKTSGIEKAREEALAETGDIMQQVSYLGQCAYTCGKKLLEDMIVWQEKMHSQINQGLETAELARICNEDSCRLSRSLHSEENSFDEVVLQTSADMHNWVSETEELAVCLLEAEENIRNLEEIRERFESMESARKSRARKSEHSSDSKQGHQTLLGRNETADEVAKGLSIACDRRRRPGHKSELGVVNPWYSTARDDHTKSPWTTASLSLGKQDNVGQCRLGDHSTSAGKPSTIRGWSNIRWQSHVMKLGTVLASVLTESMAGA